MTIRKARSHFRSDLEDAETSDPETSDSEHTVWTRNGEEHTVPAALFERASRSSDLDEPTWPAPVTDDPLDEKTVQSQGLPPSLEDTAKLPVFTGHISAGQTEPRVRWLPEAVTHKLPIVLPRPRKKKRRRAASSDELALTAAKSGLAGLAVSAALAISVLAIVLLGYV